MGFYVPYEKKNNIEIKEVKNPEIIIYNIEKDKSLEINNICTNEIVIGRGFGDRYEYIKYDKERIVNDFHDNSYGNINLKLNQRLILRNSKNDNLEFYIPYEKRNDIEVKFSEEKVISYFILEVGKSYKIVNKTENGAIIKNTTSYVNRFDYIRYKTDSLYI